MNREDALQRIPQMLMIAYKCKIIQSKLKKKKKGKTNIIVPLSQHLGLLIPRLTLNHNRVCNAIAPAKTGAITNPANVNCHPLIKAQPEPTPSMAWHPSAAETNENLKRGLVCC